MKRMLPLLVVCIIVLSGFVAIAVPIEKSSISQPEFLIKVRSVGFGLHIVIQNIGNASATNTKCFISILLFNRSWQGPFPSSGGCKVGAMDPNEFEEVHFRTIGFGSGLFLDKPNLYIEVTCAEQSHSEVLKTATILGNIIIVT